MRSSSTLTRFESDVRSLMSWLLQPRRIRTDRAPHPIGADVCLLPPSEPVLTALLSKPSRASFRLPGTSGIIDWENQLQAPADIVPGTQISAARSFRFRDRT